MAIGLTPEAHQAVVVEARQRAKEEAGLRTFTLSDADGAEHHYQVVLHPPEQGQRILWALVALGGEPLGALLGGVVGQLVLGDKTIGDLVDSSVEDVLGEVDWSAVGRNVSEAVRRTDMPTLSKALLAHTVRDTKQLRDPTNFGAAYQANYGEMLQALWEIIKANRFLPPLPTS
jgi:hypothetical protein